MMNDKNLNSKAPEIRRILPVMLKVENLHIHLDERSTSNTYFNGVEEEEPDIDIEAMIDAIAAKTGLCKQTVLFTSWTIKTAKAFLSVVTTILR